MKLLKRFNLLRMEWFKHVSAGHLRSNDIGQPGGAASIRTSHYDASMDVPISIAVQFAADGPDETLT